MSLVSKFVTGVALASLETRHLANENELEINTSNILSRKQRFKYVANSAVQ